MTDPGLRELKKLETRRAVSEAALELVSGRSYAEVTVAEIAQTAGVSRRTVSNYFGSKAECFAGAVGGELVGDIVAEVLAQDSGGTAQRLARAFTSIDLGYWENVRRLHTIAMQEPEVAAAVAFAERSACAELAETVVAGTGHRIDKLRLLVLITAISSSISVTVEHWLEDGAPGGLAALADLVASMLDVFDLTWLDPHLDAIRASISAQQRTPTGTSPGGLGPPGAHH